jgi:cation transport ATPase
VARATARAMRQNVAAAAIYNLLAVPLAAKGFVAPALAAGLMIANSLSVTLNSARLAWGRPRPRIADRRMISSSAEPRGSFGNFSLT